jgi:hypothetical protein
MTNVQEYVERRQGNIHCSDCSCWTDESLIEFHISGSYYKESCIIQGSYFTNSCSSLNINPNTSHTSTSEAGMSLAGHMPIPIYKSARFYFLHLKSPTNVMYQHSCQCQCHSVVSDFTSCNRKTVTEDNWLLLRSGIVQSAPHTAAIF